MPLARKRQISLTDTTYYRCISRCVRRTFLCGTDKISGKSFEHRKQWIEDRFLFLCTTFAIDVCAYAIMSNHIHVVLHVDCDAPQNWSDKEVVRRWQKLHKGTLLIQQFAQSKLESVGQDELPTLKSSIEVYRKRLFDISWFMKELNEPIARQANAEDQCTGHFWEGRFKSQALLDKHALAACLVYVDLNPIRAKLASTIDNSEHTSIKRRILDLKKGCQTQTLMPFVGHQTQSKGLNFDLHDYIQLVELTAGSINSQKHLGVDFNQSPIIKRLGLNEENWSQLSRGFEKFFSVAAGQTMSMEQYKESTNRKKMKNIRKSLLFN
ncbi:transposase [Aliiglaciecola sp. LCG003]|uniref:transposase n=1 Tax=Aliiglaciecola sp. LCG003 TaxID=3053655 RepID=UPI002573F39E|nr:transposase [Aliiglaciecola sp. LCG003]WJG09176.1 transposase [Aliiglaciecola sp. LCG003]